MLDIILSFFFILVTVGIIYSFTIVDYSNNEVYSSNLRILDGLCNTGINELNSDYIVQLFREGMIKDIGFSIAQQIGYFIYIGNYSYAINLTRDFVKDIVPKGISVEISMGGVLLYNKNYSTPFKNATTRFVTSRKILGFINSSRYFEYDLEVATWQ